MRGRRVGQQPGRGRRACPVRPAPAAAPGCFACLVRGARPRGCRAPARRVLGRRVRYHIGCEPGQVNGRRWRRGTSRTVSL
ncbi:tryptophan biosynthesis modulator TrpM [Streptomyces sp. 4N509B]|uniref:tryptophan biosynthesis modulator TrpM n=1 Tax=Streptomyces sp. 4N509B TaxID=3457413 RepID=UPI003FCFA185